MFVYTREIMELDDVSGLWFLFVFFWRFGMWWGDVGLDV